MKELVELFLSELPSRVSSIQGAFETGDVQTLKRLTHQLRGASAGYGFPTLGTAAGQIEDGLRSLNNETDTSKALLRISTEVNALVDMCRRANSV